MFGISVHFICPWVMAACLPPQRTVGAMLVLRAATTWHPLAAHRTISSPHATVDPQGHHSTVHHPHNTRHDVLGRLTFKRQRTVNVGHCMFYDTDTHLAPSPRQSQGHCRTGIVSLQSVHV